MMSQGLAASSSFKILQIEGGMVGSCRSAYLSNIGTDLAYFCQELDACHPLIETQSRFSRKVVQMRHQSLHDVFEPGVCTL